MFELSQLRNIAYECPFTHGTAVYEARVIAMQYDPIGTVYYHPCEMEENYSPNSRIDLSEQYNEEVKETLVEEALYSYKFYPNPSKGELFFEYHLLPEVKDAQIRISDATGRELKRYTLEPQAKLLQINESSLVNGLYYYSIVIDGKLKQTEKFVILK